MDITGQICRTMDHKAPYHVGLYIFGIILALAGCQQPQQVPAAIDPQSSPPTQVTINEVARQLGMSVAEVDKSFVKLTDPRNVVLVFTYQDGRLFINGKDCGPVGLVERSGDLVWVEPSLASRIRLSLPAGRPTNQSISSSGLGSYAGTIVIDPGHGGRDPGAISPLGYQEKTVNLQVARRLSGILSRMGFRVIMTRDTDVFLELEERAAIANRNHADLFVSIHADSAESRTLNGYTVYIARAASGQARWVAKAVADAMASTGLESNGVRQADYRVLVNTNCPAILIELGYISNYYEAARLQDPYFQQRLAQTIADGLSRYLGK